MNIIYRQRISTAFRRAMISSWHPHPSPNRRFSGRIECVDHTISRGKSPISLSAYPELTLFMQVEPLTGKCRVAVTDRRTAIDFAEQLRVLAEDEYPLAEVIILVTGNLNTHHIGCLYERFDAERARATACRLEWHYTPEQDKPPEGVCSATVHGSIWRKSSCRFFRGSVCRVV